MAADHKQTPARAWITLTGGIAPLVLAVVILWAGGQIPTPAAIVLVAAATAGVVWAFFRSRRLTIVEQPAPSKPALPPLSEPSLAERALRLAFRIPILIVDRKNRIVEANRAAADLLGGALAGTDLAIKLRHPAVLAAVSHVFHTGADEHVQMVLSQPVEQQFDVDVSPVQTEADIPDYVLLTLVETTGIRLAERMRVDFVANASHELRTPLASLIGFIETLQGPARNDAEARERFLKIMADEAGRMARLIEDLLSLSRIEQDEHVAPDQKVQLGPLLTGVARSSALRADSRGMTIAVEAAPDLPAVPGDRDQLVQVFQNLVENAIKYGAPNTAITLSADAVDHHPDMGGPAVIVRVADRGEGIAPEHLPRLTERFYRVDKARSRSMGGTGLGLAIVKHIVNRHRGQLDIASRLGAGTTISIALPQAVIPV